MFFGNRRPRILTARQHDSTVFLPRGEQLEAKLLMAIDLGGTVAPALPFAATAPYGIDMANAAIPTPTPTPTPSPSTGAGYSVADVADLTGNNSYDSLVIGVPGITAIPPATTGTTANGYVYVEFGSSYAQSSSNLTATQNWLNTTNGPNLAANDRVGNLNTLGVPLANPRADQSHQRLANQLPIFWFDPPGAGVVWSVGRGRDSLK